MNEVRAKLESLKLNEYVDQFASNGYDDLSDLCQYTKDELDEVAVTVGMKKGHRNKFVRAFAPAMYTDLDTSLDMVWGSSLRSHGAVGSDAVLSDQTLGLMPSDDRAAKKGSSTMYDEVGVICERIAELESELAASGRGLLSAKHTTATVWPKDGSAVQATSQQAKAAKDALQLQYEFLLSKVRGTATRDLHEWHRATHIINRTISNEVGVVSERIAELEIELAARVPGLQPAQHTTSTVNLGNENDLQGQLDNDTITALSTLQQAEVAKEALQLQYEFLLSKVRGTAKSARHELYRATQATNHTMSNEVSVAPERIAELEFEPAALLTGLQRTQHNTPSNIECEHALQDQLNNETVSAAKEALQLQYEFLLSKVRGTATMEMHDWYKATQAISLTISNEVGAISDRIAEVEFELAARVPGLQSAQHSTPTLSFGSEHDLQGQLDNDTVAALSTLQQAEVAKEALLLQYKALLSKCGALRQTIGINGVEACMQQVTQSQTR